MSLGAQTFAPRLLTVLERVAGPDDVRRAFHTLRDASFDNISLDLIYGIPGQEPADLDQDLAEALALAPEHLSLYELEAKPGTRFTHAWGDELERQSEAMEGYFERVVETLTSAGYRWYETANFCLTGARAGGRDLRSHHNLATWHGRDYLGVGIGAVSTLGAVRRRNGASIGRYQAALGAGGDPPRELEQLDPGTKAQERVMLALRLDEPMPLAGLEDVVDQSALGRMVEGGLATVGRGPSGEETLSLTPRGRFLGDAVTAALLADFARLTARPSASGRGRVEAALGTLAPVEASAPFVPDELRAADRSRRPTHSCSSRSGRATTSRTMPPGRPRSSTSGRHPVSRGARGRTR